MIMHTTYGICKVCGCTDTNPCYNPKFGFCWWHDEKHTVCSHCADAEIRESPSTVHRVNDPKTELLVPHRAAKGLFTPSGELSATGMTIISTMLALKTNATSEAQDITLDTEQGGTA